MRTYKRKLILTEAQEKRLRAWIDTCRCVYNLALEVRIESYKKCQRSVHRYDLINQLPELRKEYPWINDVNSDCLSRVINRLYISYNRYFKNGASFPKFASKRKFKSILFRHALSIKNNIIKLPTIGNLKMVKDAPILGTPKTIIVKIEPTGLFACIQCDSALSKFTSENQSVGLDMGISKFCTDSNGKFIENPKHFKKYERRLRIENRSLARKKKGSNSWKKQCKKLALLHYKIGNVRRDFLHKESTCIAKSNRVVYLESLNVKGMSKNKNLSKHILDCGWGAFRAILSYKTNVVAVSPAYTSQGCFECGVVDKKSRISQSEFVCTSCGHVSHADVNAAKNIKRQGMLLDRQREALACA